MSCLNNFKSNISGKKICLYGLSGDPPTGEGGHRSIVEYLSKSRNNTTNIINGNKQVPTFDYIFVLPTYKYAIAEKSGQENSYNFRLKLVKANFEGINDNKVKVLELEKEVLIDKIKKSNIYKNLSNKPNNNKLLENPNLKKISTGSIDIIRYLKENLPDANLYWCSGSDSVNDCLDGYWGSSDEILRSLSGWVVINRRIKIRRKYYNETLNLLNNNLRTEINRKVSIQNTRYVNYELNETQTKNMIMKKLRIKKLKMNNLGFTNFNAGNFYFVSNPKFKDISSTKLRAKLKEFLINKNKYLNGNSIKSNKSEDELIKQILEMMDEKVLVELIKNQNAVKRYS
jgi:hypothetical protein